MVLVRGSEKGQGEVQGRLGKACVVAPQAATLRYAACAQRRLAADSAATRFESNSSLLMTCERRSGGAAQWRGWRRLVQSARKQQCWQLSDSALEGLTQRAALLPALPTWSISWNGFLST